MEVSLTLLVKKHASCPGMVESRKEATREAKQERPGSQAPFPTHALPKKSYKLRKPYISMESP